MSTPRQDAPGGATGNTRAVRYDQSSVVITTELPAVPANVAPRSRGWDVPDHRYGGGNGRLPAPITLRLVVWLLTFVLAVALVGLVTVYAHPTWLSFLRNATNGTRPRAQAPSGPAQLSAPTTSPTNGTFHLASTNASGATYDVPSAHYVIVVTVIQNTWVQVKSPSSAAHPFFAKTITAKTKKVSLTINGSAALFTGARAGAIDIRVNNKAVGTVTTPRAEYTYTFVGSS